MSFWYFSAKTSDKGLCGEARGTWTKMIGHCARLLEHGKSLWNLLTSPPRQELRFEWSHALIRYPSAKLWPFKDMGARTPRTWVLGHLGQGCSDTSDMDARTPRTWVLGHLGHWCSDTSDTGARTPRTQVLGHLGAPDTNYGIGRYCRIFLRNARNTKKWGIPNILNLQ